MKLTPIIEALVEGNATPEMILRAVRAFEEQQDDALEQRRQNDRDRQARRRMSREVTGSHSDRHLTGGGAPVEDKTLPLEIEPQESKKVSKSTGDAEFDAWWQVYPEKVGKGAARKAFVLARSKASLETLTEGVRRYIASKPTDRSYCHPATWLNAERWLDEPALPPQARAGPPPKKPHLSDLYAFREKMENEQAHQASEASILYLPAAAR